MLPLFILIFPFFFQTISSSLLLNLYPIETVKLYNDSKNYTLPTFFDNYRLDPEYLTLNSTIKYMGSQGYGLFMNISYSSVFLKLSLSQSLIYLSITNQTFNISNYKYIFYSGNDDSCWPLISSESDFCLSKFFLKETNGMVNGYLGKDFGFLNKKYLYLQNLIYIVNSTFEKIQGIFGLGYSENEGVYGNSWIEELNSKGMISKHHFSICLEGMNSFLLIGNDENIRKKLSDLHYYDQYQLFDFVLKIEAIKLGERVLNKEIYYASINFDRPFVYIPENIIEPILRNLINNLCYVYHDESNSFYKLKEKTCKSFKRIFMGENIMLTFDELTLIQKFLPEITISLYDESLKRDFTKKLNNYFKTCPNNDIDFLEIQKHPENEVSICSFLLINYKRKNWLDLGTFFFENIYMKFDLNNAKIGLTNVERCDFGENSNEEEETLWIEILYNIVCFIGMFAICLLAINKCDNYFHDDYEIVIEEEEEDENEQPNPSQND